MKRREFLAAGLAAGFAATGCSTPGIKLDAPYVSTPDAVVDLMLDLAAVRAADVVYDLGCGDGRIVITAASKYGARGVGIDIDPRRIEEANAGARRAGVADRVRFRVEDLFKTDLSEASVVALYLFPEMNLRLRPKLLSELRPGSRIVSHMFGIGDWKPERDGRVEVRGLEHWVYLWTVPPR